MIRYDGLTRQAWAEINIDNLIHNFRHVRKITGNNTKIMSIIKADAYGHGAVEVGKALIEEGVDIFGVATLSEALLLRDRFPMQEIFILGYSPEECVEQIIENNIVKTVFNYDFAELLNEVAERLGKKARIHIKVDTGMGRLGMRPTHENAQRVADIAKLKNIEIEGIFTHMSSADDVDKRVSYEQITKFDKFLDMVHENGVFPKYVHVSNSAGVLGMPEFNRDIVRPGIMLYGMYPSKELKRADVDLRQVMSLKAQIAVINEINEGESVSYGGTFVAKDKRLVGTIPIGYGDGFSRSLSNRAHVIVKGKLAPVVGRVCMDHFMIDVTHIEGVKPGDVVTVYGKDGDEAIWIEDVASMLDTISYEITCRLNKRIPKVFIKNGLPYLIYDEIISSI